MSRRLIVRMALAVGLTSLLNSASAQAQIEIEVTSPAAAVLGGKQEIAKVRGHARFTVQQVQGDWQLVTVKTPEGPKQGWIHRQHVRQLFLPPKEPLQPSVKIYKEDAEAAAAEVGRWMGAEKWKEA